jgi:hypothetical protein
MQDHNPVTPTTPTTPKPTWHTFIATVAADQPDESHERVLDACQYTLDEAVPSSGYAPPAAIEFHDRFVEDGRIPDDYFERLFELLDFPLAGLAEAAVKTLIHTRKLEERMKRARARGTRKLPPPVTR